MAQGRRGSTGLPHLWCIWHEAGRRAALWLPMKGEAQRERGEGEQARGTSVYERVWVGGWGASRCVCHVSLQICV
jgi:hypothetical protein